MGTNFSNSDTALVAEVLVSTRETWDKLRPHLEKIKAEDGVVSGAVARQLFYEDVCLRKRALFGGAVANRVNWTEIAEQFPKSNDLGHFQLMAIQTAVPDLAQEEEKLATPITEDVLSILRRGRTDRDRFYLPDEQLTRPLYLKVDAALREMGGQWKAGKVRAFIFDGAADEYMAATLESGRIVSPKDFGFFPTPDRVAMDFVRSLCLQPGSKVLEPEAGNGALVHYLAEAVGKENVICVELLPRNCEKLRAAGYTVIQGDFLTMTPEQLGMFDAVVMNPPFGNQQDIVHINHATKFVNETGILAAIASQSWTYRDTSKAKEFRDFVDTCGGETKMLNAGAFRESGTMVKTSIIKLKAESFPWYAYGTAPSL